MSEQEIDKKVGQVMMPGVAISRPADDDLPRFALHIYGMMNTSNRLWTSTGEPPCLLTIRDNDKTHLRSLAEEIARNGLWLDDEFFPPHQLHHFWIQTLDDDSSRD